MPGLIVRTLRFKGRRIKASIGIGLVACMLAVGAALVPAKHAAAASAAPQGVYESCAPAVNSSACMANLDTMAQGGFSLVLNYDALYGSASTLMAYAQHAAADGVRIIWPLEDTGWWSQSSNSELSTYGDLAATCGCSTNAQFTAYLVNLLQGLPATWGYYLADEPSTSLQASIGAYNALIKRIDPSHPTLLVTDEDCGTATRGLKLGSFVQDADVLAADYYPVSRTDCGGDPISWWSSIASQVQAIGSANGKQIALVPQAFSWGGYPEPWVCTPFPSCASYPTEAQLAEQENLILQSSSPSAILWYSFFDTMKAGPSHWADLVTAAGATTVTGPNHLYSVDGFGLLHPASSPYLASTAYWPGWNIARGITVASGGGAGYVLDGLGGLHPFGSAAPPSGVTAYWPGWDIARGVATTGSGMQGYVLDGWGGLHPFNGAPAPVSGSYWPGWNIARGIALCPSTGGGYMLDGWGGVHPFNGAPVLSGSSYWPGWDIARAIVLDPDCAGGYVLDGWGGLHPFGNAPAAAPSAFWPGWDIARGVALLPGGTAGYIVDGWGGFHPFNGAPDVTTSGFSPGHDIMRGVAAG